MNERILVFGTTLNPFEVMLYRAKRSEPDGGLNN